ncbi:hypothetical protein ABZV80_33340 [Streptomyces sp. NPDC005132]|uniref:hypothetical protein n=1 Tax=Streptomyces sp. NPDC005132 TaxID=3154294 RepID=UPI0033B08BC3
MTELLENGRYTPALGLRLHTLAASLSQTVAWHAFDLRRHTHASQSWVAGLHNAHAAGDHDMGAGLLGDLAYQAAWRRDHTTAANILNYALTRVQNPAARCLLQLRLARTLAARGDRSERGAVLRALTAAEHHLNDAGADRPDWCAWVSEADLAVDSGQALLDLGDTRRAHQLISEGERLLPPARDKTKGVFLAYRAASYLDLKEPEPPRPPPPSPCSWPAASEHPAAPASSTTYSPALSPTPARRASQSSSNSPPPSARSTWARTGHRAWECRFQNPESPGGRLSCCGWNRPTRCPRWFV